jgi:uncharacterized protein (TIGR02266 family)
LADPNTRQGKRTPVTLKIKFKSETLEQFIERYAVDVSQGGIFIRTKEPLAVGTQMKFEFQLRDATPLIAGEGTVVWTRENDPSRPAIAPGMGVRFDRLADGSQQVLEKILAEKAKQAPQQRSDQGPTKPPAFAETPTRVAPSAVQDKLLGPQSGKTRTRSDSEQTPLPKPMPFHSDADDFPEEAFEEATKVRSLDELVAATAEAEKQPSTAVMPRDELAARRLGARTDAPPTTGAAADGAAPKSVADRDSAPGLPSPPPVDAQRKVLDTSPSPRRSEQRHALTSPQADDSLPFESPQASSSKAALIIGLLVVVAAGAAALWFFVLRDQTAERAGGGSAHEDHAVTPGSNAGTTDLATPSSPGSASPGSAGSATPMAAGSAIVPPANAVETTISSPVAKAMVEVEGQSGAAPFVAKLEKGKSYKAHVTAPGFIAKDVEVKGGDKVTAKLDPKPHTLSVTSEPPGADILIEGAPTGKQTPAEVGLTAAQAAKPKLRITLRKSGFKAADTVVDTSTFAEGDAKISGTLDTKLDKAASAPPSNGGGAAHTTSSGTTGAGAGSAPPSGTGSASSSTESGTGGGTTTPGAGSATATPPTPSGGEPEPDWSKKP